VAADLFNLATLYLLQERYPEAIRTFDRVIRLQPPFLDDTYAYLGYCLDQMGAAEEAHHAWQTALELDPNNAVARRYLGGDPAPSPMAASPPLQAPSTPGGR
jgi:tetratricopeptide (TPR) repeat protein